MQEGGEEKARAIQCWVMMFLVLNLLGLIGAQGSVGAQVLGHGRGSQINYDARCLILRHGKAH